MNSPRRLGLDKKRVVLSPELLEDRTVPAGNVTAFMDGGVLHIWGDAADNRIWVSGAGKDTAMISTFDGTTLNGGRSQLWFTGIKFAYDIQLHDGNDFLYTSGLDGHAGLFVQMGDGNDGLAVDNVRLDGANVLYTGTGNDTVSVGGGKMKWAMFDLGANEDRMYVYGTEFGDVVFAGGNGSTDSLGLVAVQWHSFPGAFGFENVFSTPMPIANNDAATVNHGQSVTINVLANDKAVLGILDPSTVQLASQPQHGTAHVNGDGSITYTAGSSNARSDSFTYTVRSSTGAVSNAGTVTISIPDTTGPTPTISTSAQNTTNLSPIPFTIAFTENVTGFDASDVSVTNGTVSNFVPVNGKSFTFDVTPIADGAVTVSVAAGAAKDSAGNDSTAATKTVTSDRTAPTAAITTTASNPTGTSPIPFTVTFSEDVTGFTLSDVTVTNGSTSAFTTVDAHTYTFNVTPAANGDVTVSVAASVATDTAGNQNTAATPLTVTFDNSAPSVTLSTSAGSLTNLNPIPFTATFSEDVTGFDVGDIGVTNGTAGNFVAVDGHTYTFDVTPTADGDVTVSIAAGVATDSSNNGNTAATPVTVTSDTTAPTPTVSSTAPDPTSTNPIPFAVAFSEDVTGFTAGDVQVVNGSVTNFVQVDAQHYTFDIVPSGSGVTVDVTVPAGVCEDAATNGNVISNTVSRTFNGTAVSASITSTASDPTNLSPIPMTATFGEDVTGFDISDISVTNGTAGNFATVDGHTYTFDVTPTADGPVVVDIAAGAATGTSGNPTSAAQFTITSDTTAPTATISTTASNPTNLSPIPFTVTFNEDVTGFDIGDIVVTNGTASNFVAVDAQHYTFDVTPTADGDVTVSVAAAVATDLAGNDNTAATPLTVTSDTTVPGATITSSASSPTNAATIPFTVTFTEDVTGFDLTDVVVTNGVASNFATVDGHTYTFDVTPTADGDVTVNVAAGVATDAAGNANTAATPLTIVSDKTNPAVTINDTAVGAITGTSSDTSGVTGVEISINNGSGFWNGTDFTGVTEQFFATTSGDNFATWSLAFSPGGPFTVNARATDGAGNIGTGTNNNVTVT